jgi:predicted phosphodiesterase
VRVFAVSDIHVDYDLNARWVRDISASDYREDCLILAGDITHALPQLAWCLTTLAARFRKVLFVPGNHDLWVLGESREKTSLQKFQDVAVRVEASGASMQPYFTGHALIVPLFGWYDYTFGEPAQALKDIWMDFHACRWPAGFGPGQAAEHFDGMNDHQLMAHGAQKVITFSHFLPRLDVLPASLPARLRVLDPVLGSTLLERQLRQIHSNIHVYGHSHINRTVRIDGVTYVNNALGYPREAGSFSKRLLRIDTLDNPSERPP